MINENKIRQIYKSNREQGFRLLVEYCLLYTSDAADEL